MYGSYYPNYYCMPYSPYPSYIGTPAGGYGGGGFGGTGCGMSPMLAILLFLAYRMLKEKCCNRDGRHDDKCCEKSKHHHDDWDYDIGGRDEGGIFGNMSNMPLIILILLFFMFSGGASMRVF
jgi:hypothetical protein